MPVIATVLAALAGLLFVTSLVLAAFWLIARRPNVRRERAATASRLLAIDLTLRVAEQERRLRLIGEMHQAITFELGSMISQADGARYVAATDPTAAARSAAAMAEGASGVLADVRRVMAIAGDAPAGDTPQLESIGTLVEVMRGTGLVITVHEVGSRFAITPGAELAVYRILQEALTNARQYGGNGTEVDVTVTWTADGLRLAVDDDGLRAASRRAELDPDEVARAVVTDESTRLETLTGAAGAGIDEMQDLAALFGGTVTAHPVPAIGFSVSALFPGLKGDTGFRLPARVLESRGQER
ncbi:MAG: ATP-binding protein [Rhodoglobus sp.]